MATLILKFRGILRNYFIFSLLITFTCLLTTPSFSQTFDGLIQLTGHRIQVYFSAGAEAKAERMAKQLDKVIGFYDRQVGFTPTAVMLVLSSQDWSKFSKPVVYGFPHCANENTLVVASQNNEFWKSFVPPIDKIPQEYSAMIKNAYAGNDGELTMEPFFDLLAIHELGHIYQEQAKLQVQRQWLGEVFVNIFLHSYVAEQEPQQLAALTVFPKMVVYTTDKSKLKFTSLSDLESHFLEVATEFPENYGWYQCRWHIAAGTVYDQSGLVAFQKLWTALKKQTTILDDDALVKFLVNNVDQSLADVQLKW